MKNSPASNSDLPASSKPSFPREAYLAAIAKERDNRDFAFFDLPHTICGVDVVQMTLRQLMVRFAINCPFVNGRTPEAEDVAAFLWHLSPRFKFPTSAADRSKFIQEIALTVPYDRAVREIAEYIDITFMDAPAESGSGSKVPTASIAAVLIDIFATNYSWSRAEILDTPLAQLYQLLREIEQRRNPKAIIFNSLSGEIMGAFGRALHEASVARAKEAGSQKLEVSSEEAAPPAAAPSPISDLPSSSSAEPQIVHEEIPFEVLVCPDHIDPKTPEGMAELRRIHAAQFPGAAPLSFPTSSTSPRRLRGEAGEEGAEL